jgi:hypothetical protein
MRLQYARQLQRHNLDTRGRKKAPWHCCTTQRTMRALETAIPLEANASSPHAPELTIATTAAGREPGTVNLSPEMCRRGEASDSRCPQGVLMHPYTRDPRRSGNWMHDLAPRVDCECRSMKSRCCRGTGPHRKAERLIDAYAQTRHVATPPNVTGFRRTRCSRLHLPAYVITGWCECVGR